MVFPKEIQETSSHLLEMCVANGLRIVTAESCTGGLVAGALTEIAGSSRVVDRGFVTYDNNAKIEVLGVRESTLADVGAVSAEVAREMVAGALANAPAQLAVAVTGIAGPGGATAGKPVGLVHFAAQRSGVSPIGRWEVFDGNRSAIRLASVRVAIELLTELVADRR